LPRLRLLADDLTGALDSAAAFAPAFGKVRVVWSAADVAGEAPALALDTGTRELPAEAAAARLAALAPFLAGGGDTTRFFKVDSLLRGHAGRELLALMAKNPFRYVIMAPAIPFQRRITRHGRQMIASGEGWVATGEDIAATFRAAGVPLALCKPGMPVPAGISLWDAESDADLDTIVAHAPAGALWVGAAGLAGALARQAGAQTAHAPAPAPALPAPLLGLVGTDHRVMQAQLIEAGPMHRTIGADAESAAADIRHCLAMHGAAFATCDLPPVPDRRAMEAEIASRFAALTGRLRPASLFVSGGETLRHLATRLAATAIDCTGQFEPGAPISVLVGGPWDGMPLISKSGAFGTADFLRRLVGGLAA
jgi:uncharacterized protein YgbK (DUF1537 family)